MKKTLVVSTLALTGLFLASPSAGAQTVDLYNPIGVAGDFYPSVSWGQFLGARFEISTPMTLTSVGGELRNSYGSFFAALVPLSSMYSLPVGNPGAAIPFNPGEVVAYQIFEANTGSTLQMITTPFSYDLSPGVYGVVLGTGLFGADGWGQMRGYATVSGSSSFFWSSEPWRWQDNHGAPPQAYAEPNIMMTVAPVPEPSGTALMALGFLGWRLLRRLRADPS